MYKDEEDSTNLAAGAGPDACYRKALAFDRAACSKTFTHTNMNLIAIFFIVDSLHVWYVTWSFMLRAWRCKQIAMMISVETL